MAKLSLQLKLGQQLTMTPQMQQAIRLLQMPVIELSDHIQQELDTNVMLETEERAEPSVDPEPQPEATDVIAASEFEPENWDTLPPERDPMTENWSGDNRTNEIADLSGETLAEHLLWQLEMDHFSPREVVMGQAIIDAINEDGYLTESLESIASGLDQTAGFTGRELETTLQKVQEMDPTGVGARNLAECLQIQLLQFSDSEPGRNSALRIVAEDLDLLASHDNNALRRKLGVDDDELGAALTLIKSLHPHPGQTIQARTPDYIVPDVYVRKQDGQWVVDINRSLAPQLKVNQAYADMLRGKSGYDTLRGQLQEARWLVRSLEIRNETLMKVAICIVRRQVEFLEHGEEAMKPMILKDIAEEVEMHESTISRVTANKYMHTPRGVVEFRYFFSSHLTNTDGSEQSSTAIRAKIRRLIGAENPAKPLSDSKLVGILAEEGIKVARRTVAKYREGMNIPSSSDRRQRPS